MIGLFESLMAVLTATFLIGVLNRYVIGNFPDLNKWCDMFQFLAIVGMIVFVCQLGS